MLATSLLSPSAAQAACDQPAANGVTASCTGTTQNQNGSNGYGTGSETGVTLTVQPNAIVSGDVYGISLGANAVVTTGAGSRVEGSEAGIQTNGANASVTVAGNVESDWFGVSVDTGQVTVANGGSVTVSNAGVDDDEFAAAIMVADDGVVTIDGTVTSSGRLVQGVFVERLTPNSGRASDITVGQTGSVTTDGAFASAIGFFGGEDSSASHRVTVHGAITTTGDHAYGIDAREVLDGSGPIRADTTVEMNGVLRTSGKAAHGIYASVSAGSVSPITISNDLRVTGADAHGVMLGISRDGAGRITVANGGKVMAQGANGVGIAIGASGEVPGLGTAEIIIAEGGNVSAGNGPAIAVVDDPEVPVDPAVGRIDTHLTIAGTIARASRSDTAVLLGAGDDRVTLLPTYDVTGVINGGDGFDTFVLDGAAGTTGQIDLVVSATARVTGFEDIRKTGLGTWRINGTVPSWMTLPAGTVEAGTLFLDATAPGLDVTVLPGATMAGAGTLRHLTIADNGVLAPGDGIGVMTMESLSLNGGSILDFELGTPGVASASDRIDVTGALTLDGMVNVTNAGGFGNGVYTLITYGTLAGDNGLAVGAAPANHAYTVNAGTGSASAVTLEVTSEVAGANQYWDGANSTHGNTQYGRGGGGIWNAAGTNWTNAAGNANAAWGDQFAIFYNGTGDVTVEGAQSVTGLQFAADGYRLVAGAGGALNLTGTRSSVRVDAGRTATLALPVTVAGSLTKDGGGTLALSGEADIAGSLDVSAGLLRIAGGGTVEAERGAITNGATIIVDGAGSVLTTRPTGAALTVGDTGDGTLRVIAGGKVENARAAIGRLGYTQGGAALPYKGVVEISGPNSVWNVASLFVGSEGGDGDLTISDGGVVNGETGLIGIGYLPMPADSGIPHRGSTGRVTIRGAGSAWLLSDELRLGVSSETVALTTITDGGALTSPYLYLGSGADSQGELHVSGAGSTVTANAGIFVGYGGRGALTLADGAQASSYRGEIATITDGIGDMLVTGTGSVWTVGDLVEIGINGGVGSLTIADGGRVRTGTAVADNFGGINLGGNTASSGTLTIGAAPGEAPAAAGVLDATYVSFGGHNGTINFNHSGVTTFAPVIDSLAGANHAINHYAGTTILTGDPASNSAFKGFAGTTTVYGGTLLVGDADGKGELGGRVIVKAGATLGGSGYIGKNGPKIDGTAVPNIIEAGGIVAPGTNGVGALTFAGELRFDAGSQLHFQIGTPGSADSPGTSDRIVMSDLNAHLNVGARPELHLFDIGGAGIGHYRIFTLNRGAATRHPDGYFTIIQPGPAPGADYNVIEVWDAGGTNSHLDLVIGSPDNLQYWQDTSASWTAGGLDWRNAGQPVDVAWAGNHGVFDGAGSTISVDGTQSFKGLQFVTSGYTLDGPGALETVAGASELRVLGDGAATIGAAITGTGGIVKTQSGTLTLTGVNSYTGRTTIDGGTLALNGIGSIAASSGVTLNGGQFDIAGVAGGLAQIGSLSGSSSGHIWLGTAELAVHQAEAATYAGIVGGDGDFTLTGPGMLTLTGISDIGLTTVTPGATLRIGDGTGGGLVSGDIHNDGTLIIDRTDTSFYGSTLTGNGALLHRGPGTTLIAGNNDLYNGLVHIDNGTIQLTDTGQISTPMLTVNTGGALRGLGTVRGDVQVLGRLLPGLFTPPNVPGGANILEPLRVIGDVSFDPAATFGVRVAASGSTDSLAVTGAAALAGTVEVTAIDPALSYRNGQTYTILSASDGISGSFSDSMMLTHSAFITPELSYTGTDVLLTLAITQDFTTVANTINQREAAKGLFNLDQTAGSDALAVFNTVAMLDAAEARAAFDLASGEIHASAQYAVADTTDLFTRTVQRRAGAMPSAPGRPTPWLALLGQSGRHNADGNAARLSSHAWGIAGGVDLVNATIGDSGSARLGLAAGYLDGRATVAARRSSVDYDSSFIGAYLALAHGGIQLSNAFSIGWHDLDSQRQVSIGALDRTARASRDARSVGYSAALRYDLPVGALRLSPLATLDIANIRLNAAQETGANALALNLRKENFTAASVGAGAELGFGSGASPVSASVRLLYDHRIGDALPRQRALFTSSSAQHTVLGPRLRDGGISAGAALGIRLSSHATLTAAYDGVFNSDLNTHRGNIALSIGF
ncbi:autotransporter domain-containing protein [Sphingomonas flavalba]|uniref:autotransporter domain-containing protein n=1 Tax=Sphingomonas flavalba TaxID=2559804 RepID=UPI0039DF6457